MKKLKCIICGKVFIKAKNKKDRNNALTCSKECSEDYAWTLRKLYSYSDRWKQLRKVSNKKYYNNHKEQIKKWKREHALGTSYGYVYINKREYKGICELCGRNVDSTRTKKLDWHHWIKDKPEIGLWLCRSCHYAVEFLDEKNGIEIPKYRQLKKLAEEGKL